MYAYSTVSPYYFDYIASARTREEIMADPDLCHLLEDLSIKDNMELAIKWREAQRGGYDEKREFLEYFYCNGPELDTDTILYYREKCLQSEEYPQIVAVEFNDFSIVDKLRITKYNKKSEENNCFTKPCDYLGPMSVALGMMGDSYNYLTLTNIFEKYKTAAKNMFGREVTIEESPWGNIRRHVTQKLLPNVRIACQVMYNNSLNQVQGFLSRCAKAGIIDDVKLGDPVAIDRAETISAATKANLYSTLGDCARLWQYMRTFNPYNPDQNKKVPINESMRIDNKNTNGTSMDHAKAPNPLTKVPPSTLRAAANASRSNTTDNRTAKALKTIQESPEGITYEEATFIKDKMISDESRMGDYDLTGPKFISSITAFQKLPSGEPNNSNLPVIASSNIPSMRLADNNIPSIDPEKGVKNVRLGVEGLAAVLHKNPSLEETFEYQQKTRDKNLAEQVQQMMNARTKASPK